MCFVCSLRGMYIYICVYTLAYLYWHIKHTHTHTHTQVRVAQLDELLAINLMVMGDKKPFSKL